MDGLTLGLFVAVIGLLMLLRDGHEPVRYPTAHITWRELLDVMPLSILGAVFVAVSITAAILAE